MSIRQTTLAVHRWVSVGFSIVWIIQALTGIVIAFQWELDDAFIADPVTEVSFAKISERIETIAEDKPGSRVKAMWESGGHPSRFDLKIHDPVADTVDTWRINGKGEVLRQRPSQAVLSDGAIYRTATRLHTSLFGGNFGSLFVGISGILLLTNLIGGAILAWPRIGRWHAALLPSGKGPFRARLIQWHRAAGLIGAPIAMIIVLFGVLLVFGTSIEDVFRLGKSTVPSAHMAASIDPAKQIQPRIAFELASAVYPDAKLAGLIMPTAYAPWYSVYLRQPGEPATVYGATVVYVGLAEGRLLKIYNPLNQGPVQTFMEYRFGIHTGQVWGPFGRIATLLSGIWLIGMIVVGGTVWLFGQRTRQPKNRLPFAGASRSPRQIRDDN